MNERNYAFRARLEQVHRPGRRDRALRPAADDVAIDDGWTIVLGPSAGDVLRQAAHDLQEYLLTSMEVSVRLVQAATQAAAMAGAPCTLSLTTRGEWPAAGRRLTVPRSYRLLCRPDRVTVCGNDERGAAQGCYYLEDLMNLREAPFLRPTDTTRRPVFSPRMTHSGWGLDQFPDAHLSAIAHAGMDAVLVFAKGVDQTAGGYQDFNRLVARAARFGLDVYFYSYLRSLKHPDEAGAQAFYDGTYGALFRACPGARGVVLVGESCEFPSRDPHTTGRPWDAPNPDGLPSIKPSPGWWPCRDYPRWLECLKRAIRPHCPDADIVFWTYNWGWAPRKDRLALIRAMPRDVSLQVTFEMFDPIRRAGVTHRCVDYTISFAGPGAYFRSEARAARARGLRLYAMANTGGMTWDFGVIPYEPVPGQWARRHAALLDARRRFGLCGLMESHHYGWWPSVVSELAKAAYWEPATNPDEALAAIARRDFGPKGAAWALKAWRAWSDAIRDYIPTNEDQYGPFRVGPSYPLVFKPNLSRTFSGTDARIPSAPHAHFGSQIVLTDYRPLEDARQSPGSARIDVEIRTLGGMARQWRKGVDALARAVGLTPPRKRAEAARMLNLGRFILNSVRTTVHVKQWWKLNQRLLLERSPARMHRLLDALLALAEREIANARETIPLVEADSRLGWEPSMEYLTDRAHLEWKIRQVQSVMNDFIPAYRRAVSLTGAPPRRRRPRAEGAASA